MEGLASDGYSDLRRGLIDAHRLGTVEPGDPWAFDDGVPRRQDGGERSSPRFGTTHLCAMDADGNAVSLTNHADGRLRLRLRA